MINKKINLKRILATAGCGTALAGALLLYKPNEKQNSHSEVLPQDVARDIARALVESSKTTLLRDTLDIALVQKSSGYTEIIQGEYSPDKDIATSFVYRDVTGKDFGKNVVANLNQRAILAEYHEIRHAFNEKLICHFDGITTPYVYAVDEISARIAEYLAYIGNMPALTPGSTSVKQSYFVEDKYSLESVVNTALAVAITDVSYADNTYIDYYFTNTISQDKNKIVKEPTISENALINELMTFEINGCSENILALSSQEMRDKLSQYIDHINLKVLNKMKTYQK